MQLTFEDKEYRLELDDLDIVEATYIKRTFGLTLKGLQDGAEELDPDAIRAVYWLMKKQNGESVDGTRTNFKVVQFAKALAKASAAEDEDSGDADPKES